MTAYTGGKMNLGFGVPVVVDVSKMKAMASSIPILADHDPSRPVGHTTNIEMKANGRILIEGVISAGTVDSKTIVESSLNGFPWQASIGAKSGRMQFVDKGSSVKVNGRSFSGPVYVARGAKLGEVSFVAIGADDQTSATVAASGGGKAMKFNAWLEANGFNRDEVSESQLSTLRSAWENDIKADGFKAEGDEAVKVEASAPAVSLTPEPAASASGPDRQPAAEGADLVASSRQAFSAEIRRVEGIQKVAKDHADIQATAVEEGWSVEKAELEVLRASRSNTAPAGHVHNTEYGDVEAQALTASLMRSAGLPVDEKDFSDEALSAADSVRFREAGIQTVMFETLKASGQYARFDRVGDDTIRIVLRADQSLQAAGGGGGFSTVSLSGILSNMANKAMLAAYRSINTVVPSIADETSTNDFKEFARYRLLGADKLEELGPDGEIKHTSLQEQEFKNKVETYARMLALTREMMVNDDLSAFAQIPRIMGRAAALTRERVVLGLLLSNPVSPETGNNFYSVGNANFISGASTNLSIGGITELEQLFLDQTDPAGDPILVEPQILLVPTSLKTVAEQLMTATHVNETTTAGTPSADTNPHVGKYSIATTPYLNSQNLTGSSSTAWYLFANPSDVPAIQLAYLRGRNTPMLDSAETDFNTLGMQWRVVYDFGVAMQDHRGSAKSAGA